MPEIKSTFSSDALKEVQLSFSLSQAVSQTEKSYASANEAQWSPLASKIFGFPWVSSVTIKPQEVIIERQDWVQWDILAEPVRDMIEHHFSFYEDTDSIEENQEPIQKEPEEAIEVPKEAQPIYEFIMEHINPQLAQHGGSVQLIDFQNGVVYLEMQGGCQGCGMAAQTMKEGIEVALKQEFPEIKGIQDITLHSEGSNPYYK